MTTHDTLEACVNGTPAEPAPTVVTKEVDMSVTGPFILAEPDFEKTAVVKSDAYTILATVIDYWKETTEGKKGNQLA